MKSNKTTERGTVGNMGKSLVNLLIELDQVNKNLDRIKNDPSYIEEKTKEVFKNRPKKDYSKDIADIMASL